MRAGWGWSVVVGAVALICVSGIVLAQDAKAGEAKPAMMAKSADPDWEVVSVRPSDPNGAQYGFQQNGREIAMYHRTVEQMLVFGYGMHEKQFLNLPEWAWHEEWDVKGVPDAPGKVSIWQFKSLVRKALVERFGLRTHTEQREMGVFALTVEKGGPKFAKSANGPDGERDESEDWNGGQVTMHAVNMSMPELVQWMNFAAEKPVIDRTGLAGGYDLGLRWTVDELKTPTGGSGPPGLSTAVEEQLGLKLEPVKAQADVLVVDQVERPGAN